LSQSGFDYDFVVHTLSDAKPMPADGVVDTAFAASEYIDMWQLDAQAGNTYLLQPEGSGSTGSYYAVYDQSGSRLASGALSNTWSSTIYASQNGPLTVVVFRGYPGYARDGQIAFSFKSMAGELDVTQDLGVLDAAGTTTIDTAFVLGDQRLTSTFEIAEDGAWVLDPGQAPYGAMWLLQREDGTPIWPLSGHFASFDRAAYKDG